MRIEFDSDNLGDGPAGLEIGIKGFKDNPATSENYPSQIYIEIYEGKLRVHVWDGSSEAPHTTVIETL